MILKFKTGDFIEVIENGIQGRIVGIYKLNMYEVSWANEKYHNTYFYNALECDGIWQSSTEDKFYANSSPYYLPPGRIDHINIHVVVEGEAVSTEKEPCKHVFVSYQGLIESFEYCTKCDEKRYLNV